MLNEDNDDDENRCMRQTSHLDCAVLFSLFHVKVLLPSLSKVHYTFHMYRLFIKTRRLSLWHLLPNTTTAVFWVENSSVLTQRSSHGEASWTHSDKRLGNMHSCFTRTLSCLQGPSVNKHSSFQVACKRGHAHRKKLN